MMLLRQRKNWGNGRMTKKICLFLGLMYLCSCLTGCDNAHDYIDIHNKTAWTDDNIGVVVKEGYFYDSHEKFTVDEDTVGVTIYFSTKDADTWK
jgi:hypothetical protein